MLEDIRVIFWIPCLIYLRTRYTLRVKQFIMFKSISKNAFLFCLIELFIESGQVNDWIRSVDGTTSCITQDTSQQSINSATNSQNQYTDVAKEVVPEEVDKGPHLCALSQRSLL